MTDSNYVQNQNENSQILEQPLDSEEQIKQRDSSLKKMESIMQKKEEKLDLKIEELKRRMITQ